MELPHQDLIHSEDEWNVIEIFRKLDRKNIGVLDSNNCAI